MTPIATPEPRARHSRNDVVDTAMRMLAHGGLPAFSMRALARELEVQPSALYWHFADKQTLLAAISEEILDTMGERPESETLEGAAIGLRDALLAHVDGAEIVLSSISLGLAGEGLVDRFISACEDAGCERSRARAVATASIHYVLGHVSHEQQRAQALRSGVDVAPHGLVADANTFAEGIAALTRGTEG